MAIIQGKVFYDPLRSFGPAAGIAGVRVVLYDTAKKQSAAAATDKNGSFTFFNVPKGNYLLVESYHRAKHLSEVNFLKHAQISSPPVPKDPPVKLIMGAEKEVTRLDSMDSNVHEIDVEQSQLITLNFYNAPVIDIPFTLKGVKKTGRNLFSGMNKGTFGKIPQQKSKLPRINGFVYKNNKFCEDGFLTITNSVQTCEECWQVTDHTKGLKSGLFLAVKGCKDSTVFLKQAVSVNQNTDYLMDFWVTAVHNPAKTGTRFAPRIGLQVKDKITGEYIFKKDFCPLKQSSIVTWVQLGCIFNSGKSTQLVIELVNLTANQFGGAFAVDDISLYKADVQKMVTTKKELVKGKKNREFRLLLTNNCDKSAENIHVYFKPSKKTEIISKTTCKGCSKNLLEPMNPLLGVCVGDLPPHSCTQLSCKVKNHKDLTTKDISVKLLRCCLATDCGKLFYTEK